MDHRCSAHAARNRQGRWRTHGGTSSKAVSNLSVPLPNIPASIARDIDDVIAGVNTQQGKQGLNLARMAVLDAGFPQTVPGFSLDRFCGSGLTALNLAAMGIMSGAQQLVVAGGVEQMSHTRTLARESMMDSGNMALRKRIPQPHQGLCADLIATLEGLSANNRCAGA